MNQKIIDKITKLLARADESRNDNPHERAIAMRQANSLLVKHGLSMTDISSQSELADNYGALGRKQHTLSSRYVWESGVWSAVARLNGCKVIRSPRRGLIQIWIVGRQLNCTVTQQIAEYAVNSIKREAKNQGHTVCAFGVGAWTGITEQIDAIIAAKLRGELDGEQLPESTALVVVNQHKNAIAETGKAYREFFPRAVSGSYGYGGSRSGMSAGKDYGKSINLNNQIGGAGQRRIAG
jgi:hypothetical protein